METKATQANWLLGLLGAALGGAAGYAIAFYLGKRGLFLPVLPGVLVGLGCALLSRGKSLWLGICCAAIALVLGVLSLWQISGYEDSRLSYFLSNLNRIDFGLWSLILLGVVFAGWAGTGRRRCGVASESSPE